MQIWILALLVNFASTNGNLAPECYESFNKQAPWTCCKYPFPKLTQIFIDECKSSCKDAAEDCCNLNCLISTKLGIHLDGELKSDDFVNAFDLKSENSSVVEAVWSPVIKKSFEACLEKSETLIKATLKVFKIFFLIFLVQKFQ